MRYKNPINYKKLIFKLQKGIFCRKKNNIYIYMPYYR